MGCFLGCFGVKDSGTQFVVAGEPSISRNKNSLSSLFVSDDDSPQKGEEGKKPQPGEIDVRELKDQAKFLKACGTLPETPLEIRKASKGWVAISYQNEKQKFADIVAFPSLKSSSIEKTEIDKQPNDSPKPVKISDEMITRTGSVENSPSSCMTHGHNNGRHSTRFIHHIDSQNATTPRDAQSSITNCSESLWVSTGIFVPSGQSKMKSVRFDCDYDRSPYTSNGSSSETSCQQSKEFQSAKPSSVSKLSPFPTPLKLTSDMQTPGTIFPAYLDNEAGGKTARVRSQYVCPTANLITSIHMWKELKDEYADSNHSSEFHELNDKTALVSTATIDTGKENLSAKEAMRDEGLSSWCKSVSSKQDDNKKQLGSLSCEVTHHRKTPGDRPIIGMVAAHWNDDEISRISPKCWDGNGIPNSTNKYKEDQKVNWHATPFEERLEKALSDETFVSKRKTVGGTTFGDFNEAQESDSAVSHLQPPIHVNSVVLF